jgi:undecaprenyl diphosphate synthase
MWQSAYSELFFTKTLWPDLTKKEVDELIEEYKSRQRNFGGVKNA